MNGPAGPIIYPAYLNQKGAEFLFRFGRAKGAHNDVRDIVYAHPPWPATGPMGPMPHRGRDIFITLWPSDRPIILPSFAKERGKSFLYNLSSIDHPGRNPTSFLLFLSSFEESFEDTCHVRGRRRRGRIFRKVARIVSRISSFHWRIGDDDDFIAAYRCHLEHDGGVGVSARGKRDGGRVRGDKEGRRCGALVATGAVQLPPRNEGRPL